MTDAAFQNVPIQITILVTLKEPLLGLNLLWEES